MRPFPEVLTHNYDPARGAFRNICHLPPAQAQSVLDQIHSAGKRRIKANYLQRRLAVEDWLISERKRLLGPTRLRRPIYFFLGDFADGKDPSRPQSYVLPLTAFPPDALTFTYPDSMASLPLARRDDLLAQKKAHHGRVFTLEEIKALVAEVGMPGDSGPEGPAPRFDRFIEVQLWDDAPIRRSAPWY